MPGHRNDRKLKLQNTFLNAKLRMFYTSLCMSLSLQATEALKIIFSKQLYSVLALKVQRILKVVKKQICSSWQDMCKHAFVTVTTVGVLCWSPGVLQTGKPWGAIREDVQHLGPQVRWELENIPDDISCKNAQIHKEYISYTLHSEVFIRDKPPTLLFSQLKH